MPQKTIKQQRTEGTERARQHDFFWEALLARANIKQLLSIIKQSLFVRSPGSPFSALDRAKHLARRLIRRTTFVANRKRPNAGQIDLRRYFLKEALNCSISSQVELRSVGSCAIICRASIRDAVRHDVRQHHSNIEFSMSSMQSMIPFCQLLSMLETHVVFILCSGCQLFEQAAATVRRPVEM